MPQGLVDVVPVAGYPRGAPMTVAVQPGTDNRVDLFAVDGKGALNVVWIPRPFTPGG
jgi:hypothetical protein